ncbi:hypothetical protein TPR58_11725 [Sphingomonas sp. HF-S3]|uniref:Uncharacterized protein n=1 Tax=Sphingomonas rustica TaxID=3103142 RepID=A0ABV0BA22_9SPHN
MILAPVLLLLAASPAMPPDPEAHARSRDASCTPALFDTTALPDGRRTYREKRTRRAFPSSVGRLTLVACAVGPEGFEVYYESDPANPVHERCPQLFQIRYIPDHGSEARAAVEALTRQWGGGANPAFGTRRFGSGDHLVEVQHASGTTVEERGRGRRTQFAYDRDGALVLGGEASLEDPMCNQASQNSQTFLREFPWF